MHFLSTNLADFGQNSEKVSSLIAAILDCVTGS